MNEPILAVDDEPLVLNAYQRTLGQQFRIYSAVGPEMALSALRSGTFAVILSDLKMPGMDGVTLLQKAAELQPQAVRIMISGHADIADAIRTVNQAGVFRLLLKPCDTDALAAALNAGLAQSRLVTAEKALLEETLNGAVQSLMDILGILDAGAFGQAQQRRRLAKAMAKSLPVPEWELEMAALLAEIGRATLPPAVNEKIKQSHELSETEQRMVERVPDFSCRLLGHIPRIEAVVAAVRYQDKHFDGHGFPEDALAGEAIPLGARVLHVINAFVRLHREKVGPDEAVAWLRARPAQYDPRVVGALLGCVDVLQNNPTGLLHAGPQQLPLAALAPGMDLLADIVTRDGVIVLGAGVRLNLVHLQRVKNFAHLNPIVEPILVDSRA